MRMMRRLKSLRWQLAVVALLSMLFPLVALLGVVFTVQVDSSVEQEGTLVVESTEVTTGVSPWIPIAALLLTLPAALLALWWSRRAVEPVLTITEVANDIQAGTLDRRIALTDAPTEVQALADSFDSMLDRLSSASNVQRRMIEETSHELRTPLTALRVNVDNILAHPDPSSEEWRSNVERTRSLVERLQTTIESQLVAARAENLRAEQVDDDLMMVISRAVAGSRSVHAEARITVSGPREHRLPFDSAGVERAVRNMIDNAVAASPPDGVIAVEVSSDQAATRLSVTDDGRGVDPDDIERIFDRYFTTKTDNDGSHGIGLAVVKQVAEAHGGIEVESPPPGQESGARFTMVFEAG